MTKRTKNYTYSPHGFTLLETLTSIAILALVIIGPLSVIMSSSSYARQTKDVVIATYLAEESIELLQNQYDSLYLFCKNEPTHALCETETEESGGQIAWRVFKERLGAIDGYPSCYLSINPDGCSFDYLDMTKGTTTTPPRYTSNDTECPFLVGVVTPLDEGEGPSEESLYTYACAGLPEHITGSTTNTQFKRTVFVTQVPTFEGGFPEESQYNDDLRVTAEIEFKGVNGLTQVQRIIRFFHARP